jgi:uncharacterized membrane protein YcaP (DUF421 family)
VLIVAIRTTVLYVLVVAMMRFMGKRQVGEMQPFELVVTLMIAEIAFLPMQDVNLPLINGLVGVIVLAAAHSLFSALSLVSYRARKVICGQPTVVVDHGLIVDAALVRLRMTVNDLLEQLRSKDYPNVADVAYAILETNGKLSVIPYTESEPPTARDLAVATPPVILPVTLIIDGKVIDAGLKRAEVTREQLTNIARSQQVKDLNDVFFAERDTSGKYTFQLYGQYKRREKDA